MNALATSYCQSTNASRSRSCCMNASSSLFGNDSTSTERVGLYLLRNDGSILSMATFHGCRVGLVDSGVPSSLCILASHVRIDCPVGFLRFLEQRAMESMQHEECSVGQHHRHHQLYRYGMYPRVMLCRVVSFRPIERWHVSKMTAAPNRRSAFMAKSIPFHPTSHHITS